MRNNLDEYILLRTLVILVYGIEPEILENNNSNKENILAKKNKNYNNTNSKLGEFY